VFKKKPKISIRDSFALSKLQFKCRVCSEVFEHANSQAHQLKHLPLNCPLGCGVKAQGSSELEHHLFDPECPNAPIYCNDCGTETTLKKKLKCTGKLLRQIEEL
jgi:hypothetical protein